MDLNQATRERIDEFVRSHDVALFMKGNPQAPQCGFSATVVGILDRLIPEYRTLDVLQDPEVRDGIKAYSSWPTIPQLYVKGEFVGGCDIIQELFANGELNEVLGVQPASATPPELEITDRAREALQQAHSQSGEDGRELHLSIDAHFRNSLSIAPVASGEIQIQANGISVWMDPMSASRAAGLSIDVVDTPQGPGFQIDNPQAPGVRDLAVEELRRRLDAGERFEFLDVRTPEERAKASIPGSVLLSDHETKRLESLPRDTTLVFHCHSGVRSRAAAEHFASLGFSEVFNVEGGIEAWAVRVDPNVPRY